jgi:hypothetical protein
MPVSTTPGAPVNSAVTAAIMAAAVSPRASTKSTPCRPAAAIRSRLESPPGTPKMRVTPRALKAASMASARVGDGVIASATQIRVNFFIASEKPRPR